jgi:hypothetical protein
MHHVRGTPINLIWLAVLLTALSYLALIARDFCALSYADLSVPAPDFLLASFCASALGNAVGLGTFTGSAVRSRVYGVLGVGAPQIAKIMSFINMMFGSAWLSPWPLVRPWPAEQQLGVWGSPPYHPRCCSGDPDRGTPGNVDLRAMPRRRSVWCSNRFGTFAQPRGNSDRDRGD